MKPGCDHAREPHLRNHAPAGLWNSVGALRRSERETAMDRDNGTDDGREVSGGIGPPGSVSRRRLLQGAAAAGLSLGAAGLDAAGATAAAPRAARGSRARSATAWATRKP